MLYSQNLARAWTFIFYPESAPEDWRDILESVHVSTVISPLHLGGDNDRADERKPHRHVMIVFEGKKSFNQVFAISSLVNGTQPFNVASLRAMCRYFIHADQPDKEQFFASDLVVLNGADVDDYLKPTKSMIDLYQNEMLDYIEQNQISEFSEFAFFCRHNNPDWNYILKNVSTQFFKIVIQSVRNGNLRKLHILNFETGEISEL